MKIILTSCVIAICSISQMSLPSVGQVTSQQQPQVIIQGRHQIISGSPQIHQIQTAQSFTDNSKTTFTMDQKTASDAKMSSGLTLLQNADSALRSGDVPSTLSNLANGYDNILSALPHYNNHRYNALVRTQQAYQLLNLNGMKSSNRVDWLLNRAIMQAQAALNTW